jgi:hypothetical protein
MAQVFQHIEVDSDTYKLGLNLTLPQESLAFRETVLYITYNTILTNPNITDSKLSFLLGNRLALPSDTVNRAVSALSVQNVITRWTQAQKNIVHLAVKGNSDAVNKRLESQYPELKAFTPPRLRPQNT